MLAQRKGGLLRKYSNSTAEAVKTVQQIYWNIETQKKALQP